jgi:uncharacterized RDD family membrane protein YckC
VTGPESRTYAGIVSRGAAFVVDALTVVAVALGAIAVVELIGPVVGLRAQDLGRTLVPVATVCLPVLFALYSTGFWALAGRTPGMAVLGIRGTRTGGRSMSWTSAALRAVVFAVFPIGALWCLVDRRHQAVHDKLARTLVVRRTLTIPEAPWTATQRSKTTA